MFKFTGLLLALSGATLLFGDLKASAQAPPPVRILPIPERPGPMPGPRPPSPPIHPPGWDWWRIYPWSTYNYGRNPYNPIWIYPYPGYPYGPAPWPSPSYPPGPMPYPSPSDPASPAPATVPAAKPPAPAAPSETALDWPLALRILPPATDTQGLRQQIDGRLAEARRQAAAGRLDPSLVPALDRDVNRLSRLLREQADVLPASRQAVAEAESFLARLKDTIKTLR